MAASQKEPVNIDFADDAEEDVEDVIQGNVTATGFGTMSVRPEDKLKAVIDITRALTGETDLDGMLPKILDTLFMVFPQADRGCVVLKDADNGQMIPKAYKHRRASEDATVKLSRTILSKVLTEKKGIFGTESIKWNFTKFLVGPDGHVVKRYGSGDTPEQIDKDLE